MLDYSEGGKENDFQVMYVTCIFPYATLIVFLVHAMTLEGAWDGLFTLLKPDVGFY